MNKMLRIATSSLLLAAVSHGPLMASEANPTPQHGHQVGAIQEPQKFVLNQEQMDDVTAGRWKTNYARVTYQRLYKDYLACGQDVSCQQLIEIGLDGMVMTQWVDDFWEDIQCYTC